MNIAGTQGTPFQITDFIISLNLSSLLNPTYGSQNNPWTPKPHQPPNRMH